LVDVKFTNKSKSFLKENITDATFIQVTKMLNSEQNHEECDPEFRPPIIIGVLVGAGATDEDSSTKAGLII
jgi:hypothetical protein